MNMQLTLKEKIDSFFNFEKAIHKEFGYVEDWVDIPMEDHRQYYWFLRQHPAGDGEVYFSEKPLTVESIEAGEHFSNAIYTQRFLPKWVYETEDFTMISVDTQTDGNKFLAIFDNTKKQEDNGAEF